MSYLVNFSFVFVCMKRWFLVMIVFYVSDMVDWC